MESVARKSDSLEEKLKEIYNKLYALLYYLSSRYIIPLLHTEKFLYFTYSYNTQHLLKACIVVHGSLNTDPSMKDSKRQTAAGKINRQK